ncbi:sigma-54 dependent transcriptional regulator [Ectothiorhodospira lacustris]|uniref:sigma-54 dependent transcriptional regulator n=1 Tax=Ectothiorhodospira lacustris TaxID=2899127 RepID=UPI001EE90ED1|nr:sigma-54 dependent transcriptional regulator [Ectothiorhodospira lacustris]MCG5501442.1 sigma-54 dependent transcriptional regulator [Ectothiorhodospira lacustris]MCG5509884.1 sigma-54 dependent transcriptional regulator [Ectothiorhodospira lacustris]MCG5521137.1 sigma-54 dependent transcriptional regulator [Ectothiorhodospira lacustris]
MDPGRDSHHRLLWIDFSQAPSPPPLGSNWHVLAATTLAEAEAFLRQNPVPVGAFLLQPPTLNTLPNLEAFLRRHRDTEWVALVEPSLLWDNRIRELLRHCCHDFHSLPIDPYRLKVVLGHASGMAQLLHTTPILPVKLRDSPLIGENPSMIQVMRTIEKVARVSAPVLITGESGTGKEVAAKAVHDQSPRADGPFEAINCAAVPASLIQSELFGHERGAFTGAHKARAGRVQAANGGTLFLDEIGDLPLEVQAALLRFLQNQTVQKVGSDHEEKVDVRVVAATHVDLEAAVHSGRFREDLYYRLDVLRFEMPPLRERGCDSVLLARHFFRKFSTDRTTPVKGFSPAAMEAIRDHRWPGNVRELINRVRRALVLCEHRYIQPVDLGLEDVLVAESKHASLETIRADAERQAILDALQLCEGNVSAAARRLDVSRITLYRLARRHDIPLSGQEPTRQSVSSNP